MLRASNKPLPLFFRSAAGSRVTDVDGNRYVDYTLAWGPLIFGHSYPAVVQAVEKQLKQFQLLGAQHRLEVEVAQQICRMVPCAERVAFSNTGSEAVQLALRLARAFTGRRKIVKFEGHYHGWIDNLLISYHPKRPFSPAYKPQLTSEGQSRATLSDVIVLPWNNPEALENTLRKHSDEIAAIITEPVLCNSSCLMPRPGYLELMRELSNRYGLVLIFDEVITGFRVAKGGAQALFGVVPDLATFGKAVACGFPLSVVAGKKKIMELISRGRVVHAGTFNGNPVSLAAAKATLDSIDEQNGSALKRIQTTGETLMKGILQSAKDLEIPVLLNGVGAAFHLSFTPRSEMRNYRDTLDCNPQARDEFIEAMLQAGVYLLPDGRWYVSAAHSEADVAFTLRSVQKSFEKPKDA
jgi:glutamate-1-semialdehyde 2,1-aminomutase